MHNSHKIFQNEIEELKTLYSSSIIAFKQTKKIKKLSKTNEFYCQGDFLEHDILKFPNKTIDIEYTLRELVLVRLISALEVYLVDNVRYIFIETKEPFKKNQKIQFDYQEVLSFKSVSELYNKIINKECRQLSSEGFEKIITYYEQRFNIDLSSLMPSKSLILEYHDKRHLIVHRLGKTDKQFRDKYNIDKLGFSISHEYICNAIDNISNFAEKVMLKTSTFLQKGEKKRKESEENIRKIVFIIKYNPEFNPEFIESKFEFWSGDDLVFFKDILILKKNIENNMTEITIQGERQKIKNYYRIAKAIAKKNFSITYFRKIEDSETKNIKKSKGLIDKSVIFEIDIKPKAEITEEFIEKIKVMLPEQPWKVGIHKKIAQEMNVANSSVSKAIQILIKRGIFKHQINGKLLE